MSKKDKQKKIPLYKHALLGIILTVAFVISAAVLLCFCIRLDIFPAAYLIAFAIAVLLISEAILFANRWKVSGIIADVISFFLIAACVLGCFYADITRGTLTNIQSSDYTVVYMGVYVMDDDPAEELEDTIGYTFGYDTAFDDYSTQEAIAYIEEVHSSSLDLEEYENMYVMLDELAQGVTDAIILSESYMSVAEEVEDYEWVEDDIREIAQIGVIIASETEETEEDSDSKSSGVSETMVIYISGIDSYGDVSVTSRSDVNILAVVNTTTGEILLINTPRDFYVQFEATNGSYDKLTHAGIYGIDQSEDALETLYDIEIDYYVRMNFSGFETIIDALGGITVYSEYSFTAKSGETFVAGYNTVNGEQALAFARERKAFSEGDRQRGKNQMAVIEAVINKLTSFATFANFQTVMNAVADSFETDMTTSEINALIKFQLSGGVSWNIESVSADGTGSYETTYSAPGQYLYVMIPDYDLVDDIKEQIQAVLYPDEAEEEETEEDDSDETGIGLSETTLGY